MAIRASRSAHSDPQYEGRTVAPKPNFTEAWKMLKGPNNPNPPINWDDPKCKSCGSSTKSN